MIRRGHRCIFTNPFKLLGAKRNCAPAGTSKHKKDQLQLQPNGTVDHKETCQICFEHWPTAYMLALRNCVHRICRDCISRYVEQEIKANKVPVRCPYSSSCTSDLDLDDCRPHLSANSLALYERFLIEASIPQSERIYCPFSECSALMLRDAQSMPPGENSSTSEKPTASCRACVECHRPFCVRCHVAWHDSLTCEDYQIRQGDSADAKLFQLATTHKWQQCKQCRSMIEVQMGCDHIICQCKFHFCYKCGNEWHLMHSQTGCIGRS